MPFLYFQLAVLLVDGAVLEMDAFVFPDNLQEYVERDFLKFQFKTKENGKLIFHNSLDVSPQNISCRNYFVILIDGRYAIQVETNGDVG